ncbi:MAG: DUF6390 family protein [Nocardioidaceae bacterium]
MSGPATFARYAFPPNELGYCGPAGASALLERGSAGLDDADVADRARGFDGAWPYLEIIAAAAGMTDPLDPRVVEAYWIGNELLDLVDPSACLLELRTRFAGQATSSLDSAETAVPHHTFHVLAVYPWVGMLGRGNDAVALSVLEQCRIRWGTVRRFDGERATVETQPLTWAGGELALGPSREESVRWSTAGSSLVNQLAEGDVVALHWDWVCDLLDEPQSTMLTRLTQRQLSLANAGIRVALPR